MRCSLQNQEIRNPKHEILNNLKTRNPKQETQGGAQIPDKYDAVLWRLEHLNFAIRM
jgi:hypothetical protein